MGAASGRSDRSGASWTDTLAYRARKLIRRNAIAVVSGTTVSILIATLIAFYTVRVTTERDFAEALSIRVAINQEKTDEGIRLLTSIATNHRTRQDFSAALQTLRQEARSALVPSGGG